MRSISVSSEREYEVKVGTSWLEELHDLATRYAKVLLIAPAKVLDLFAVNTEVSHLPNVKILQVPDGEAQKNFVTVEKVWSILADLGLTRSDAIVGLGGGATTDLAGFAAATWLRGIDWFAFPTTLAGMVDASVGGKTGINSAAGKNLIGSFHSPSAVFVDLSFLPSLSDRDFSAGLAEVIKTGLISDIEILEILAGLNSIDEVRGAAYELILRSIAVKASVVSADFKEGKLREILNFGHTLGHAVEKESEYKLRHGEAVAIGLGFALELSGLMAGLPEIDVERGKALLLKFGLSVTSPSHKWPVLLEIMRSDKKARGSRLRFIGISEFGVAEWIESVEDEDLARAYERIAE